MKLCYTPLKFQGQNWRRMEIEYAFFLTNPRNPISFLVDYAELAESNLSNFVNLVELNQ